MLFAPLMLSSAVAAGPMPGLVPGTVSVALSEAAAGGADAEQPYADAVGQALGEANFTVMPGPDHSRYLARVAVSHEGRGVVTTKGQKGRPAALIGAGGPAVVLPFGAAKLQLRDLVATTLTITLVSRVDRRQVWSGSAVTVQVDGAAVPVRLARAVVATFPQTLASPVSVP